ncbi:hypothetical protein ACJJI3_01340 [Microbulbifer sp. ZKSA004]|uniref:hypothetical protein n=1 Tax=unclassified Microbulbifer TaxID=2619833 RepID=UPI0040399F2E
MEQEIIEKIGPRPLEPAFSNEDPEGWAAVSGWEDQRAELWESKCKELQAQLSVAPVRFENLLERWKQKATEIAGTSEGFTFYDPEFNEFLHWMFSQFQVATESTGNRPTEYNLAVWRMRDTGTRRASYRYFPSKEEAEQTASIESMSRDDGHLTDLTPLYEINNGSCSTCCGRGEIGGITQEHPCGYSEPCPDCNPAESNSTIS